MRFLLFVLRKEREKGIKDFYMQQNLMLPEFACITHNIKHQKEEISFAFDRLADSKRCKIKWNDGCDAKKWSIEWLKWKRWAMKLSR